MIKLQDGTILDDNQYVIKEQFDGVNLLTFTLPDDVVVHNEDVIFETIDRQEYVVKIINGDYITCELNLDGLKAQQTDFSNNSATPGNTLTQALSGTGWTGIDQTGLTSRKTITGALTPFDIIQQITDTWDGVTVLYDTEAKTVTLVFPALNTATVTFLTEDLNLRQLDIAGDSSNFCTRIRAEGKDGLTFASINNGKDYVENYSYSSKVIYGEKIVDNRFTDKQSLLEYAQGKLDAMAVPSLSYECDVVDVASYDSNYSFLELKMHKAVWLLDKKRDLRIQHRVVAYERHPANPENNKVTLATVLITLQQAVKNADNITMGTFSGDRLADNSVNGDKIANGAVGSGKIADGAVGSGKIANGAVSSGKLADGSVVNSKLGEYAVGSSKIANSAVTNSKIGAGAVDTAELANSAVTNSKIGSGAVDTAELASSAVTTAKIASYAVTGSELAGSAVTGDKVATDAIVNRHITSGSIYESTCNSTIQGYFADIISANKLLAGQATITTLKVGTLQVAQHYGYWYGPNNTPTYVFGHD